MASRTLSKKAWLTGCAVLFRKQNQKSFSMFFFFFPCPHQQQTNKQTSKISNMASYFPLFPIASLYSSFINLSIYASPDANMAKTEPGSFSEGIITLESVRESLIRQEDTIVFNLIERARYPRNSPLYNQSYSIPGFSGSLFQYIVSQSENLYARVSFFLSFFFSFHSWIFALHLLTLLEPGQRPVWVFLGWARWNDDQMDSQINYLKTPFKYTLVIFHKFIYGLTVLHHHQFEKKKKLEVC